MGRSGQPGRGGGRGFGRGGGRGRGGSNKKNKPNSDKKETTSKKFVFTLLESTVDVRVSAYETTLKKLYQQLMKDIRRNPEDVVDSLKDKKKKSFNNTISPFIEIAPSGADAEKIQEVSLRNETYKLEYLQAKQDERRRADNLESNLRVAYNAIFANFCDKELQNRLENREDFVSKIENDPIELLSAIKDMMHTTLHEKLIFPFETLWTTLGAMFKLKQDKDEKLSEYFDKMKAFSAQVKKYLPDDALSKFIEGLDAYKSEADSVVKSEMKKGAWKRLVAFGFLYNSDREKYGKLLKDYKTDYANKSDNFPVDLVSMRERMSIACNEEKHMKKKNKEKEGKEKAKNSNSNESVTYASSFAQVAQGKKVCWVCGGDHLANVCPLRDKIPREKWYKETMESHHTKLKNAYVHYVNASAVSGNGGNTTENENESIVNENSGTNGQRVSWDSFPSHMQIAKCHSQNNMICEQKNYYLG